MAPCGPPGSATELETIHFSVYMKQLFEMTNEMV